LLVLMQQVRAIASQAQRAALCISAMVLGGCFLFPAAHQEPGTAPQLQAQESAAPASIVIDSREETLAVYRPGKPREIFGNLAFGAAGVKEKMRVGDDVTPRGVYTVGWVSRKSKFVHFIGLNYPSLADAERGLRDGRISRVTYDRIVRALKEGRTPPQDTALGGWIGIHGVGRGSLEVHRIANWTAGCIAMENSQIEKLARLVHIGMKVEIR